MRELYSTKPEMEYQPNWELLRDTVVSADQVHVATIRNVRPVTVRTTNNNCMEWTYNFGSRDKFIPSLFARLWTKASGSSATLPQAELPSYQHGALGPLEKPKCDPAQRPSSSLPRPSKK